LKLTGETAEIVFDGAGPSDKTGFDNIIGLEVIFAGRSSDADTIIEDKIKANTAPKRMMVVSSDRRLRAAARARKATTVKSEFFWRSLQKQLSRKKPLEESEPSAKRLGLSSAETEQWLKFFGLDQ
jgi:predicted RNA-binding protein with PIN domain